jgi:hypothetical protein
MIRNIGNSVICKERAYRIAPLLSRLETRTLDNFDSGTVRPGDVEEVDWRSVGQRERAWLTRKLHMFAFEHGFRVVVVAVERQPM